MRRISLLPEAGDSTAIDLTPLLDVVFIMLIFFIVTASFVRETGLTAVRSESTVASAPEQPSIVVRIDADNGFWIDGLNVEPRALSAHLVERHARLPDSPVLIQPDRASTTRALVQAMDAVNEARIVAVAIADATDQS